MIRRNPAIKGFIYINYDWRYEWKDSRIQTSPAIVENYKGEMDRFLYLHGMEQNAFDQAVNLRPHDVVTVTDRDREGIGAPREYFRSGYTASIPGRGSESLIISDARGRTIPRFRDQRTSVVPDLVPLPGGVLFLRTMENGARRSFPVAVHQPDHHSPAKEPIR